MSSSDDDESEKPAKFQFEPPKSKEKDEIQVLDPDNPLLEKFQKALKEHLLKQIEHLKEDIFEYVEEKDCGVRKNNAKREELGVLAYEQQQIIQKQQTNLDNYISKIQTSQAAREEIENVLVGKRESHKKERDKLIEMEAKEIELRNEIEGMNLLIYQMSQWEDNLESDITVKKRVYEKTRKDKSKLLEEKRLQDGLIYRLMKRIWQLEQELDKMDVQIKLKEEEREQMAQTVALGNTNIEAMESEHRCLMHSWNSVIIAIGNRDKVLTCLNGEFTKLEEQFKSILSEIEQVKKLSHKQMKRNEDLTLIKKRFIGYIQNCKTDFDTQLAKKAALEKKMNEMHGIIEQTDLEIQKLEEETHDSAMLLESLNREYMMLDSQKGQIEEKIMKELEEQVTTNKSMKSLQRALKLLQMKNREMEIHVATIENRTAAVVSEIENQKFVNTEATRYLAELEERLKELGKEADVHQDEMKKMDVKIAQRQREVDLLNIKYQKMVEKSGIAAVSPMEAKISALEKSIEEIQEKNKKLQQFWLREQTNLIKVSEERQEQIQNNNLIRKQILMLEQKNLRVTDDLEKFGKQLDKVTRNINNLHSQLTVMGDNLVKTKGLKITMDKDNDVLRQDYVNKLKDAELNCLKLQDEIAQIEEDKLNMSNELMEINRQSLEWERKFLSAKEAKEVMIEERGKEGEVGAMKAEIHRMNVRYGQLRKVQDVLIQDLEHCISRRDAILTVAEAREKRVKGGLEKTRFNFNRKLDDLRNKSKQMENQIDEIKKKIENMDKEKKQIQDDIKNTEVEIENNREVQEGMKQDMEEAITTRQMNFELLLQMQKKLNMYTDISKGRKPHLYYRTEDGLTAEFNKEREINGKLTKIVENLQSDFPNHNYELDRISNTLKLPVYVYYQ